MFRLISNTFLTDITDCTNGHTYATVLHRSVVCLSSIMAIRCVLPKTVWRSIWGI